MHRFIDCCHKGSHRSGCTSIRQGPNFNPIDVEVDFVVCGIQRPRQPTRIGIIRNGFTQNATRESCDTHSGHTNRIDQTRSKSRTNRGVGVAIHRDTEMIRVG